MQVRAFATSLAAVAAESEGWECGLVQAAVMKTENLSPDKMATISKRVCHTQQPCPLLQMVYGVKQSTLAVPALSGPPALLAAVCATFCSGCYLLWQVGILLFKGKVVRSGEGVGTMIRKSTDGPS